MEKWKNHPAITDLAVSTEGNVKRLSGKRMAVTTDSAGYKKVTIGWQGKRQWRRVHQLVMETFSPQPREGLIIDHIDDNKSNNRLDNLRWVTNSENLQKAADQGKMDHGGVRKPIVSIDEEGTARVWESSAEASRALGVADYTVARVLKGNQAEARTANHSYTFFYICA